MVQPYFDAGIWIIMVLVGFACLVLYKKIGALLLSVSIITFLVAGLVILTGYDVSSFSSTVTSSEPTGINQTSYLIGNGSTPVQFTGQLLMGWSFIVLCLVVGVIFLDQVLKGNFIKGD